MGHPARLLLLAPSIRNGGMERLVSILLRGLDRTRFQPELMVLHRQDENRAFLETLPSDVAIRSLAKRSRADAPRIVRSLASRFRTDPPAAAIGFMTYPNLMLLAARVLDRHRVPVIATEHVTPDAMTATWGKRLQIATARRLYRHSNAVVAVSRGMGDAFVADLALPRRLVRVIHNPYDPEIERLASEPGPIHPWIDDGGLTVVAVGRLSAQKAYPRLIRAVERIREELDVRLIILGEGEERANLEAMVRAAQLSEVVDLPGFVANPFPFMRRASAYVLSSDWEGFPFVLVEASRAGAAVVATDCPFGPDEIIEHGKSGLLVPPGSVDALAAAIREVLRDKGLASRLRRGAVLRAGAFAPEEALRQYQDLIESVMRARPPRGNPD